MKFSCLAGLWLSAGFLVLAGSNAGFGQPNPSESPGMRWKNTDDWNIVVEHYGGDKDALPGKQTASFPVAVRPIAGGHHLETWSILRFTPSHEAPEQFRSPFYAWVQKHRGWLGRATQTHPRYSQAEIEMKLLQIGQVSVLAEPNLGMPLEMLFPNLQPLKIHDPETGARLELRREEKDAYVLMEATFQTRAKAETRLTQIWDRGKSWWRETIRHVNGRKTMHAKLISVESREQLEEWLRKDINLFLVDNDKLCVRMTFVRDNPLVRDVLAAVQEATGVRVSLVTALEIQQPELGNIQMREVPAWALLKFVASKLGEAQWEHFEGGYRLNPARVTAIMVQPANPLCIVWWLAATLLAVTIGVLFRRLRRWSTS